MKLTLICPSFYCAIKPIIESHVTFRYSHPPLLFCWLREGFERREGRGGRGRREGEEREERGGGKGRGKEEDGAGEREKGEERVERIEEKDRREKRETSYLPFIQNPI
jgi:hypothetical protein